MATGTLTWACLLVAVSAAPADVWPFNQRNFNIPIAMNDPARRKEIKEMILYSSADQGRTWNTVAVGAPDKEFFPFNAPADGLYWFALCIVDRQGNRDPVDITKTSPQKILIDTVKPLLRIVGAERQGDEVLVGWDIQDENLDVNTLKLEYRPAEASAAQWYSAALSPSAAGQTRFRVNHPGAVSLRMQVQDQAGNVATTVTEAAGATGYTGFHSTASTSGVGEPARGAASTPALAGSAFENPRGTQSVSLTHGDPAQYPPAPPFNPPASSTFDDNSRIIASSEGGAGGSLAGARPARGTLAPAQIVNNPQVSLDYEFAKVGPSGIGKVELYVTQDNGLSWRCFAEDPDLKPPLTVELPGEGVYGLSLVVLSKAGLGKRPPQPGELPEMRIEVDSTPPSAKLCAPESDPRRPNTLLIGWTVADRNLAPNPIALQWAERPSGNWETIGSDLPNTGRHTWQLPPNLPYRVYLRLIARDLAGNTCVAETPEPRLVDLNEPEGRLLGIAGSVRKP